MKSKKSKQVIWEREVEFAKQPKFWQNFGWESRNCAEFLMLQYNEASRSRFDPDPKKRHPLKGFFCPTYVRLLVGIALENMVKGLLLSGVDASKYISPNRISFGKKGHDILWLFEKCKIDLSEREKFFVSAWAVCTEWFGKYPFPLEPNRVLDEYESMPTREALNRRVLRGKREFLHSDLLHTGIGVEEWETFEAVFLRVEALYPPRK